MYYLELDLVSPVQDYKIWVDSCWVVVVVVLWHLFSPSLCRTLPQMMWSHLWKMLTQGFAFALLWPFVPQFVCNCLFYWALYFSPIINIDLVVQQLMHPETVALWQTALDEEVPNWCGTILQQMSWREVFIFSSKHIEDWLYLLLGNLSWFLICFSVCRMVAVLNNRGTGLLKEKQNQWGEKRVTVSDLGWSLQWSFCINSAFTNHDA